MEINTLTARKSHWQTMGHFIFR